jgi:hypothetical protein
VRTNLLDVLGRGGYIASLAACTVLNEYKVAGNKEIRAVVRRGTKYSQHLPSIAYASHIAIIRGLGLAIGLRGVRGTVEIHVFIHDDSKNNFQKVVLGLRIKVNESRDVLRLCRLKGSEQVGQCVKLVVVRPK